MKTALHYTTLMKNYIKKDKTVACTLEKPNVHYYTKLKCSCVFMLKCELQPKRSFVTWKKLCMPVFETYDFGLLESGSGIHRFKIGSLKIAKHKALILISVFEVWIYECLRMNERLLIWFYESKTKKTNNLEAKMNLQRKRVDIQILIV